LRIFFSDPGRLFENFKTDLTDAQIKSIEEVFALKEFFINNFIKKIIYIFNQKRSKIKESEIYNEENESENKQIENEDKKKNKNFKFIIQKTINNTNENGKIF